MEKDFQVVGFRVGRETFGLPITRVREIVRVPQITAVPNAPDYIEGVINLRGRIISVIDLRKRFGVGKVEPSKKNRVVVIELGDRLVGLIVHSASEVLKIPPSQIEAPQNVFPDEQTGYVSGVGKLDGRLILLLDLDKILEHGELRRLGAFAESFETASPGEAPRGTAG